MTLTSIIIVLALVISSTSSSDNAVNPVCAVCHDIVRQYQKTIPRKPTQQVLNVIGTAYCSKKKIQNPNVCKGAVTEMMDSIVNSLWRHYTDPHAVCHNLRLCPKEYTVRDMNAQIKQILTGKPNKQWEKPTQRKIIKAIHISDLHPDLFYTAGAPAKCTEPVCCRSNVTLKMQLKDILAKVQRGEHLESEEVTDNPAGFWGSLNSCDLPIQTFQLFLKEVAEIKPDLIIWTGDNTPHDIWQQTQSYNLNFTVMLSELMRKSTNARVIGAMGNHESFPVNVYDYEGDRQKMLVGGLAEAWKPWLTPQAYDMLRTKGYFSITIPEFNNLKIISINTQAQNDQNWYNLRNPTDPGQMLKWIQSQLKESEAKNQFVYMIGHIPPASALNDWAMRFNALTERYTYNIRGQFYGHTHRDHVGFFPSFSDMNKLAAYYLISPSLTTYSDKHPQYRVMSIDYDTLQVVDYQQYRQIDQQYRLDLTKFKKREDNAKFQLFYRFKEAYGIEDMTIRGGMTKLMDLLKTDNNTQIKYTYLKSSGVEKGHAGKDVICDTMPSPQWATECNGGTFKPGSFQKAAGKWKDLQHKEES